MKKIVLMVSLLVSLTASLLVYAQSDSSTDKGTSISWSSKNSSDSVSIQNGAGIRLNIPITVDRGGAGVNVKNCGTTSHIDPGSATMCSTNDPTNPVTLTADSATIPATGTYQINAVQ